MQAIIDSLRKPKIIEDKKEDTKVEDEAIEVKVEIIDKPKPVVEIEDEKKEVAAKIS